MLAGIALFLLQTIEQAQMAEPTPIPPLPEATERIASRDAELFHAAFEGCEPDTLSELVTEDFRMLHDLGGVVATSRDQFITMMEQQCAARAPGGANEGYKNRRLIVPGSVRVTPLGDWGVLQRGYHTFQEWRGEELGWVQTGGAHFINVWQWDAQGGVFRMQETISVDHG